MKLLSAEAITLDKGLVMRICCISNHLLTGGMFCPELMGPSSTFKLRLSSSLLLIPDIFFSFTLQTHCSGPLLCFQFLFSQFFCEWTAFKINKFALDQKIKIVYSFFFTLLLQHNLQLFCRALNHMEFFFYFAFPRNTFMISRNTITLPRDTFCVPKQKFV